jgi:hypothetical protein
MCSGYQQDLFVKRYKYPMLCPESTQNHERSDAFAGEEEPCRRVRFEKFFSFQHVILVT